MTLFAELKRRNVFKVGAAYLALGWVVVQITATLTPALHLPESALRLVTWIGVIGFPIVLVFAWIYELTPEGLKRESEIERRESITHITGRKLDFIIIGLLVAAIAITALDRFVPRSDPTVAVGARSARDTIAADLQHAESRAQGEPRDLSEAGLRERRARGTDAELGGSQGSLLATPAIGPDDKSIAVLPFVNMSSDEEQEYFSDGIAEELLNALAKIPDLKVIARTSSFAFKGEKREIAEIAKRLGVAHVLEGSVRKSGDKVRITAQLVRAADSTHLWSQTYDRTLDDIFAVQDEIAGAVVSQLEVALLGSAPKARETNPEAFALTLQARHFANQRTDASNQQAIALYKQALAMEPRNPRAWDGLARVYISQAGSGDIPPAQGYRLAREAANSSLDADPGFALALARLAGIAADQDGDLKTAVRYCQRALELDAGDAEVLEIAADLLAFLGRADEALAIAEYLGRRDPVNAYAYDRLGVTNIFGGHWDAAATALQSALSLSPGSNGSQYRLGLALLGKGDAAGARAAFEAEQGDEEFRVKGIALAAHLQGRTAEFEAAFGELRTRFGDTWPSEVAQVYAWTGDTEQAFAWLDRAVAKNEEGLNSQYLLPLYRPLHKDPRWQSFRERTGTSVAQLAAIPFEVKLPK